MLDKKGLSVREFVIILAMIAVVIACAIPMIQHREEREREARDVALIRSAYEELRLEAIQNPEKEFRSEDVPVSQKKKGWQYSYLQETCERITGNVEGLPKPGGHAYVLWKDGQFTVIFE